MAKRILIVEDDAAIARLLQDNLAYDGFDVQCAGDGPDALLRVAAFQPDLVLLDLMLPGQSGFDVCRILRSHERRPAIIVLTARREGENKVRALNLGADDYVTKPFALDELLARVNAVLRRTRPGLDRIALGHTTIEFRTFTAYRGAVKIDLRPREIELLRYLAEHQGSVVTRDDLLRDVWGYRHLPLTRTVDIAVARIRRKIEPDPHEPRFLRTVHGTGYCLVVDQ